MHSWIWELVWDFTGDGNGTPLQYPCLENPMDGGAWWAAVSGVAQSQTQLKRLGRLGSGSGTLLLSWEMCRNRGFN